MTFLCTAGASLQKGFFYSPRRTIRWADLVWFKTLGGDWLPI
jgi:hypothetical protein